MIRDDGSHVLSQSTDWMNVETTTGDVLPLAPKVREIHWEIIKLPQFQILSVHQHSSDSAKVFFSHNAPIENAAAKTFVIVYNEVSPDQNKSQVVSRSFIFITVLQPLRLVFLYPICFSNFWEFFFSQTFQTWVYRKIIALSVLDY